MQSSYSAADSCWPQVGENRNGNLWAGQMEGAGAVQCPPTRPSATDDRPMSDRVSKLTQPAGDSDPACLSYGLSRGA